MDDSPQKEGSVTMDYAGLVPAVEEYSFLIGRGYAEKSALSLVGNRHQLNLSERMVVQRASCSDDAVVSRQQRQVALGQMADRRVVLDGYNVMISILCAMGDRVLFKSRDGCIRDVASMNNTVNKMANVIPALNLLLEGLEQNRPRTVSLFLDRPISGSGKLRELMLTQAKMLAQAKKCSFEFEVHLDNNPDEQLIKSTDIVVSADSWILDNCRQWVNLTGFIVEDILGVTPFSFER